MPEPAGIFERLALGSILRIINTYLAMLLRFIRTRSWRALALIVTIQVSRYRKHAIFGC